MDRRISTWSVTLCLVCVAGLACAAPGETGAPASGATSGGTQVQQDTPASPDVVGQEVAYDVGGVTLKGYLAWDRGRASPRPGVVVVHEWWGHNEYVRTRARMLAELGYTALAIDMYGDGKSTQHPEEAKSFMQEATKDLDVARARFVAGLEYLKAHETTDPERVAAIGYCFGGGVVLHMARAGIDLDAVASFHGSLATKTPAEPGAITAQVLVMTGDADPLIPAGEVAAFDQEMKEAGAQYEIIKYPSATHAFTNPGATALGKATGVPLAYNEAADVDSWQRLQELLHTTFNAREPSAEQKGQALAAATARGELARLEAAATTEKARWTDGLRAEARALAEATYPDVGGALKKILSSPHRMPGNRERDVHRHPEETLKFLGIKPNMTIFEYGPGAGWYTELLAPMLAAQGKLVVNNGNPDGPRDQRGTYYAKRLQLFLDKAPEVYGKVQVVQVDDITKPALELDGSLDAALVVRGFHGWKRRGAAGAWLVELHKALKPDGILGVIQHRAAPDADPKKSVERGRLPEKAVIDEIEAAGFKLVGKSDVNANPKDTRDHPAGVWTLPPTLRLGDKDRQKYLEIGESDRMTLKFVRIDQQP
ncbi:MAG: dienelactone hydrolase family protein [Myxococcales bacterium]|nr:dienelactone hydrolase family protein [Myxococcales bacterium]